MIKQGKVWVMGREGQHGLIQVSLWIKVIIIIMVLKPDSGVYIRQCSSHESGESTRLTRKN
jgi:hypothetical protein